MGSACECGDQADAVPIMLTKDTTKIEVGTFNRKTNEACLKEKNNNDICREIIMNCFKLVINNRLISSHPSYIYIFCRKRGCDYREEFHKRYRCLNT